MEQQTGNKRRQHRRYGHYKSRTLDECIDRTRECHDFSAADVAYFLQTPPYIVVDRWGRRDIKKGRKFFPNFHYGRQCSYRLVSQIYEANDRSLSLKDIQRELTVRDVVVEYALDHRPLLESRLIEVLQLLYPDRKIDNPYL